MTFVNNFPDRIEAESTLTSDSKEEYVSIYFTSRHPLLRVSD